MPGGFAGMHVNHWTIDYGPVGRKAIETPLDPGHEAGLVPQTGAIDFIG